jgi:hypothetical protein
MQNNEWKPEENIAIKPNGYFQYSYGNLKISASISSEDPISAGPPLVPLFPFGLGDHSKTATFDLVLSSASDTILVDLMKVFLCYSCRFQQKSEHIYEMITNKDGEQSRVSLMNNKVSISSIDRHFKMFCYIHPDFKDSLALSIRDVVVGDSTINIPEIKLLRDHNLRYLPLSMEGIH